LRASLSHADHRDAHASGAELESLIRGCRKGSAQAQKELYNLFSPTIYSLIRRYLPREDMAQDVLSEVFYKAITRIGDYSGTGSFEGWLRRIATNAVTDVLRVKKWQAFNDAVPADEAEISVEPTALSSLGYKHLLQVIHSLPDTQRAVFCLFAIDGYSHRDIAEALNISENNSRWHLSDARRRLKEYLTLNPMPS
jgi:RNA polymerase sigma-70 factor (ECF subfamily)